jgi:drug/metabolite transporter (DMT)-like permease
MKNKGKAYFFAVLAILFWSTVATAFKISLRYLDVPNLLFIASVTSTAVLFLVLACSKKVYLIHTLKLSSWGYFALVALLNPLFYYLVLFKAYSLLPAQVAQPLNYTWPIVLSIFSALFLKERLRPSQFFAISVSFIGAIIIATEGNFYLFKGVSLLGTLLALFSAFIWATFWILNMKAKYPAELKLFLNFFIGTFYVGILLLSTGNFRIAPRGIVPAMYVGVFEMGITYLLFLKAISLYNTAALSNLVYLSPFLSLVFIHIILKEQILPQTILGLLLIVLGIILNETISMHSIKKHKISE